ncbi:CD2-associated protein-like [Perognathus longimembris pacificus]|uniref:CD2-associated protein-like n=1 Tax=Perognathus longimembris pacificus TaxID=214514 RepID=UPI0020197B15|nr:CD2-associated protein-like [Perognathus longimembris pacificus]
MGMCVGFGSYAHQRGVVKPPHPLSAVLHAVHAEWSRGWYGDALARLVGPVWAFLSRARPGPPPAEVQVLVLAGYRAQKEDELSLVPGDVIQQVREGPTRGWLRGTLGGHCGLFPKRLVQEIPEALRGPGEGRKPRCPRRRPGNPRWAAREGRARPVMGAALGGAVRWLCGL